MQITKQQAVTIFTNIGFNTAEQWSLDKLNAKANDTDFIGIRKVSNNAAAYRMQQDILTGLGSGMRLTVVE